MEICHAMPYTIDNTSPIVYEITNVKYDEDSLLLIADVNATYVYK